MKTRSFVAVLASAALAFAQEPQPVPVGPPVVAPAAAPQPPKTLALGMRVPAETVLVDIDGKEHRAGDCKGKITVVNFYSITCPIMRGWEQRLAAIEQQYGKQGVVFLDIDANSTEIGTTPPAKDGKDKPYEKIRAHLAAEKLPFTVLADHGNVVADFFGAQTTPHVFVFAADGKLVYRGLIDDDQHDRKGDQAKRYLRDTLDQLLAGKTVTPSETKSIGCAIKRAGKPKAEPKAPELPKNGGERD